MPKKSKNIWADIISYENLALAFRMVRKGKRFQSSVLKIYHNLDDALFTIQEELETHTWQPAPYRQFWITEVKPRLINAPAVRDRVIHWALMLQVGHIFERRFIDDSYACRTGKGTHLASQRMQSFLQKASNKWGNPYILKCDISKYFPSIDQEILMQQVRRIIADKDALWIFETIIKNGQADFGVGIPIGALTSQWLANLYLDALDHYIKDDLGIKYYLRYMDDFVIVTDSKECCQELLALIDAYVTDKLHLKLNPKTTIYPSSHGVDFVGYRHWTGHKLPRKRTVKRARKIFRTFPQKFAKGQIDLEYIRPRMASFTGYMSHCDGYETLEHILANLVLTKKNI